MMVEALKDKGYNSYAVAIPFANEVLQIFKLAASVFIMMLSKVAFYSLLVYFATSMDTQTVAAYQVLMQIYCMFAARRLLKSLLIVGASCGLIFDALLLMLFSNLGFWFDCWWSKCSTLVGSNFTLTNTSVAPIPLSIFLFRRLRISNDVIDVHIGDRWFRLYRKL
ncbi:hypothetical protein HanXRQr2_Chr05g0230341 [Helianthus annuus]|uniref:Uncharacterized protein n=1 Tax=Helianthus annuus TaxID=4232 RepID=A0A9K3J2I5_HELAN|nr:hypothetical protein HanXRQr2_Chr05g0230341 [Helianthus annuus]KAJ0923914.1 hypothetical protein HanPSC8_Chr05g0222201 [Helianthus annuus]